MSAHWCKIAQAHRTVEMTLDNLESRCTEGWKGHAWVINQNVSYVPVDT